MPTPFPKTNRPRLVTHNGYKVLYVDLPFGYRLLRLWKSGKSYRTGWSNLWKPDYKSLGETE